MEVASGDKWFTANSVIENTVNFTSTENDFGNLMLKSWPTMKNIEYKWTLEDFSKFQYGCIKATNKNK